MALGPTARVSQTWNICMLMGACQSFHIHAPSLHPVRAYELAWVHIGQQLRQWVFPKVPEQEIHDVCSGWEPPSGHSWINRCPPQSFQMRRRHQVHSLLATTVGSRLVQLGPRRNLKWVPACAQKRAGLIAHGWVTVCSSMVAIAFKMRYMQQVRSLHTKTGSLGWINGGSWKCNTRTKSFTKKG